MSFPKTQKVLLVAKQSKTWETLKYTDIATPQIQSDEDVIIKNHYAGVNFVEAYFRDGTIGIPIPWVLGRDGAGEVAAIGKNVTKYKVGDKVAYLNGNTFAQYTKIEQSKPQVLKLPPNISKEHLRDLSAGFVPGILGKAFIEEAHEVKKGQNVLIWAASGGLGQFLIQLVTEKGANAIAIASTKEKLEIAKKLGAKHVINSQTDNIVDKVAELTNNAGVDVSYDSVGKDSFEISLKSLKRKGTFVSFGTASGPVPSLNIARLGEKNLKLVRPALANYVVTSEEFDHYAKDLLKSIESGALKVNPTVYKLQDYPKAAEALETRKTTGRLVLEIPQ